MKNIKSTQPKKGSSKGWTLIVIGTVAALCIGGVFTVRNVMASRADADAGGGEGQVSVAVVSADVPAGGAFDGSVTYMYRNAEEIPADSIQSGYDFSGAVAAIGLAPNTVLTQNMVMHPELDESDNDTNRFISVNYVELDSAVAEGDFVDIRLKKYSTEDGFAFQDDVVLAKKKVHSVNGGTVVLSLSENEQLTLGIAAVDASSYGRNGDETATLYSTRYVGATQEKAKATYANTKLSELIETNPNILAEAKRELAQKQQAEAAAKPEIKDNSGVSAE